MDLIYAWDIPSLDSQTKEQMDTFEEVIVPGVDLIKIGYQLFTAEGPRTIGLVIAFGGRVFLDLKYNDIPNTVCGAVKAACDHGVALVNVHALGGLPMMEAAAKEGYPGTKVVAVTLLTSLRSENLAYLGLQVTRKADGLPATYEFDTLWLTQRLASGAREAGLDGVVCAVSDAATIHPYVASGAACVPRHPPGLRLGRPGPAAGRYAC